MPTDTMNSAIQKKNKEHTSQPEHRKKPLVSIAVVDDNPTVRRLAQIILEKEGYLVDLLENGKQALEMAHSNPPDLMLLDCQMPDINGYEVCRQIHRDLEKGHFPVIFISGNTDIESKLEGFESGGIDYITKPFDPVELKYRIKTHLELSRHRRQIHKQARQLEFLVESQNRRLNQLREAQENLLTSPEQFPELNLGIHFQPALEAGGDFYDILKLSDDQYGFLVADVSGHDLGSAYITGALKALTVCFTNETLTVDETFFMLNSALIKFLDACQYATACYIKYTRTHKKLDIICAGHPAPIILRKDGTIFQPEMSGMVLGMMDEVDCDVNSVEVAHGDRLYLFTDGLIEGYPDEKGNTGSRFYGNACLMDKIIETQSLPIKSSVINISKDFQARNRGAITDDVILMGIAF